MYNSLGEKKSSQLLFFMTLLCVLQSNPKKSIYKSKDKEEKEAYNGKHRVFID
jgi:hypothetical protein